MPGNRSVALVTALAAGVSASASSAADLDVFKTAIEAKPYSWTGFYVGANVGGNITSNYNADAQAGSGFSFFDNNTGLAAATLDTGTGGLIGGVQVGYNYQYGPVVVGVEADISALQAGGGSSWTSFATFGGSTFTTSAYERLDDLGTVRGRLAYVLFNRWLVYATGGLAYGEVENNGSVVMNASPGDVWSNSTSKLRTGYALGGGVEWAITDNVTLRFEDFYYSFGGVLNYDVGNAAVQGAPTLRAFNLIYKTTTAGDVVRVGADYKF